MQLSSLLLLMLAAPLGVLSDEPEDACLEQISCEDEAVEIREAKSVIDCWRICRSSAPCSVYTFVEKSNECRMHESCQDVQSDSDAISGHLLCTPKQDFRVYLRGNGQSMQYTLDDSVTECPVSVDEGNKKYLGVIDNQLTACDQESSPASCSFFNPQSGSWELSGITIEEGRFDGALLQSLDEKQWYIFGGRSPLNLDYLSSVLKWQEESEQFLPTQSLPMVNSGGCISRINRTHSLMTGGSGQTTLYRDAAFIIEMDEGYQRVETTPTLDVWGYHACGTYYREDGAIEVILAKATDEVEIFDVQSQQWREGPYTGVHINAVFTVPFQWSFKVFGSLSRPRDVVTYDGQGGWNAETNVLEENFQRGEPLQVFKDQICS